VDQTSDEDRRAGARPEQRSLGRLPLAAPDNSYELMDSHDYNDRTASLNSIHSSILSTHQQRAKPLQQNKGRSSNLSQSEQNPINNGTFVLKSSLNASSSQLFASKLKNCEPPSKMNDDVLAPFDYSKGHKIKK